MAEVFQVFLRLGCTSFGGPVAHLAYFRLDLVERRRWLDEATYADLMALCQFLPGPSSSQVAVCLGILRAGIAGGLAAWCGFCLPSAVVLTLFALGVQLLDDLNHAAWLHGLKIVAVAVVAHAVWNMALRLCPDRSRMSLAVVAAVLCLLVPSAAGQLGSIAIGALIGWRWFPAEAKASSSTARDFYISRPLSMVAISSFAILLILSLQLLATPLGTSWNLLAAFFRSGSLVFGGGHVVLPLLQSAVCLPGWISIDNFLAGYGAAQAVPGPLFSLAAYVGASSQVWSNSWLGGLACLLAIYLPSFLLLIGVLPFWGALRRRQSVQSALKGINAAVVGLLLAALYSPVWTSAIFGPADFGAALIAFLGLTYWKAPAWLVVVSGALLAQIVSLA